MLGSIEMVQGGPRGYSFVCYANPAWLGVYQNKVRNDLLRWVHDAVRCFYTYDKILIEYLLFTRSFEQLERNNSLNGIQLTTYTEP